MNESEQKLFTLLVKTIEGAIAKSDMKEVATFMRYGAHLADLAIVERTKSASSS